MNALKSLPIFCLIPMVEFGILRLLFKYSAIRIGWESATDFHFLLPVFMATLMGWGVLTMDGAPSLRLRLWPLAVNVLALLVLVGLTFFFRDELTPGFFWQRVAFFAAAVAVFASACFWFVDPKFVLGNTRRWVLLPAFLISCTHYVHQNTSHGLWTKAAPLMAASLRAPAEWLTGPVRMKVVPYRELIQGKESVQDVIVMGCPTYTILVGLGCSGLDGMYVFLICYLILVGLVARGDLQDRRGPSKHGLSWIAFLWLGLMVAWVLNLGRILFLYALGVWTVGSSPATESVLLFLYHAHAGWIIQFAWIYFFCSWVLHNPKLWDLALPPLPKRVSKLTHS